MNDPAALGADRVIGRSPGSGPANSRTYAVACGDLLSVAQRAERAGWRFVSLVADASMENGQALPAGESCAKGDAEAQGRRDGASRLDYVFQVPGETLPVVLRAAVCADATPSIARLFPGASWAEREVRDLFGIAFSGMPDDRPLIHHEDWPEGLCPARQGERLELPVERAPGTFPYRHVEGEGVMEIRVGPIHAGIIEPGHFRFSAIGEMVVALEVRLFYVHRGLEQRAVGMALPAAIVLAERASGTSAVGHSLAAARAMEAALGVQVPPCAAAVRALLLELERFHNHVGDLGNLCAGTAMSALLAEGFLLKERLWEMGAALTGNRLLRGLICLGGLRRRPTTAELEAAVGQVRRALESLEAFAAKFFNSASNRERLTGTGVLSLEHARKLGTVGVVARASGIGTDSRIDWARGEVEQAAYQGLTAQVESSGDVLARAQLRLREARESARLCEALLAIAARGGAHQASGSAAQGGEGLGWAEGARGEILTYARVEAGRIARLRVRSPSRMNWPAIVHAMPGNIVPDFPLINKSFNLSYAGCDL